MRDPLGRVDHEQRGVGSVDRFERAYEAVVLGRLVDAALAPQPRGVDEPQWPVLGHHDGVDRIARRARQVVHDGAVFPHEPVEQRRLADVRPARNGHAEDVLFNRGVVVGPVARFGRGLRR